MGRTIDRYFCPFAVLVDSREQAPFTFEGLKCDADRKHKPLVVEWRWHGLKTGDYSIDGFEGRVAVERKSLADLYGSVVGDRRDRFEAEHQRMAAMETAAVVVEADWPTIMSNPGGSKLDPKTIYRTWLSWSIRYGVPWYAMPGRRSAEVTTFRFLEMFWRQAANELQTRIEDRGERDRQGERASRQNAPF